LKNRIVTTTIAVSAMTFALTGCASQMSDEDVNSVRESACSLQNSFADVASLGLGDLNAGKFWAVGPRVAKFSETLSDIDGMGEVADAYADFADMFTDKGSSTSAVFQEDVDTFNGHVEAISIACKGNSAFEEPTVLEYPTDVEERAHLQGVDSAEEVK
jgi:hypothetical protein